MARISRTRDNEAIQLDRHGSLRAPRDAKAVWGTAHFLLRLN